MKKTQKQQQAQARHKRQKRVAQYRRYLELYVYGYRPDHPKALPLFEQMLSNLHTLNLKTLQVLLHDLRNDGYMYNWSGDYHRQLIVHVEHEIMAKTLLKE